MGSRLVGMQQEPGSVPGPAGSGPGPLLDEAVPSQLPLPRLLQWGHWGCPPGLALPGGVSQVEPEGGLVVTRGTGWKVGSRRV